MSTETDPRHLHLPGVEVVTPPDDRPPGPRELDWKPQPMVDWLHPGQLLATAIRTLLSTVFGSYADRREVAAALALAPGTGEAEPHFYDHSAPPAPPPERAPGFWIDYTADLGDGFKPGYTVASFLGAPAVRVGNRPALQAAEQRPTAEALWEGADSMDLPRGDVLVMGGDQVYPTPSRDEYANRLVGPYEAAFPSVAPGEQAPTLYAIPGNHDWYDGLTAFTRLFGQARGIGAWKTAQKRSYFALRLPNRWWLLGIDVQLHADIDLPQVEYFKRAARGMEAGDRVILCTPEPAWVAGSTGFANLAFFEKEVLCPRGAELALTVAGDLHHYARYQHGEGDAARHKITAGGGGAYLLGTGILPDRLDLSPEKRPVGGERVGCEEWELRNAYPTKEKSWWLRLAAPRMVIRNGAFTMFLAFVYACFAWLLQSASKIRAGGDFMAAVATLGPSEVPRVLGRVWTVLAHAPALSAYACLIIFATWAFCAPDPGPSERTRWWTRLLAGGLHGVLHVVLAVLLTWGFASFNLHVVEPMVRGWLPEFLATRGGLFDQPWQVALFFVEMLGAGGMIGGGLFSLFLLFGLNYNEAYSAQHLAGYKNFLRMHIDAETGELSVYPFGIDQAGDWEFVPGAAPGAPYFKPVRRPRAFLLEAPIRIAGPRKESTQESPS